MTGLNRIALKVAMHTSGLLTDLYEINMAYAYWRAGMANRRAVFDLFFRSLPCGGGYAVAAGLKQAVEFIQGFLFEADDLAYLSSVHSYERGFLAHLKMMRFTGDLAAIPEGTVVFGNEPLLRIKGNLIECQLLESALLTILNHQTLIATKAARIVEAAGGKGVIEFGLRRAHGPKAAVDGARAAYIGGAEGTSNLLAGKRYGIPVAGTHAHAMVQAFASELEAFRAFAADFPRSCILLIDTYDTLASGLPHAIQVFTEMKRKLGDRFEHFGVRLDSGDLAYLSKECRKRLDAAGFGEARIIASNELDEFLIRDLRQQGAQIDAWGVGTKLITSYDCAALGGVYKLAAIEEEGKLVPRIKLSENPAKMTTPGEKKVVRFFDQSSGQAMLDLIQLADEPVPVEPFEAFDPVHTWKRKRVERFAATQLLVPIIENGRLCYAFPNLPASRAWGFTSRAQFAEEVRRLNNPYEYHVDLSARLWELRRREVQRMKRIETQGHRDTEKEKTGR